MPRRTPATSRAALLLALHSDPRKAAAPLALGAALAWIELATGFFLLPLGSFERAEILFFLACRPWVLILGAVCAAHWTVRRRIFLYTATLAIAAAGETMLVIDLGAADPWPDMLRGLAPGIAAAAAADLIVQALRRWRKRLGRILAPVLLGALLFAVNGTRPYEALILGPTAPREAAGPRPPLLLMTSLPIVWGAGGAFDPNSRPSETYRALEREFEVTPIDAIEPATLGGRRLMLLAQPRALAPEELVALDAWVRGGGRLLVLSDPELVAARAYPLGDPARPPETGMLAPLLSHWGVRLEPRPQSDRFYPVAGPEGPRRLMVDRAGQLALTGPQCRTERWAWLARCTIGQGQALLVADADLLTDAWAPVQSPRAHERHLRIADNPLVLADWLDSLAGLERERRDRPVAWIVLENGRHLPFLRALLPGLAGLAAAFLLFLWGLGRARRAARSSTHLSTGLPTENNPRTDASIAP